MKTVYGIYRNDRTEWMSEMILLLTDEEDAKRIRDDLNRLEKDFSVEYILCPLKLFEKGEADIFSRSEEED